MSRPLREYSVTGIYHVMFRGVNKQQIFNDTTDYFKFKKTLVKIKQEMDIEIYAYCLMSNHVHILLKEKNIGDLPVVMKRLLTGYAMYYNLKYDRSGPLFESRYKSKAVELDEYFLALVRYIHKNPLKAKLVNDILDYTWSSYYEYVRDEHGIADKTFVMDMIDKQDFIQFHRQEDNIDFEIRNITKKTTEQVIEEIKLQYSVQPQEIEYLNHNQKVEILNELKNNYSLRTLEEITGISKYRLKNIINS